MTQTPVGLFLCRILDTLLNIRQPAANGTESCVWAEKLFSTLGSLILVGPEAFYLQEPVTPMLLVTILKTILSLE